jgi:hypothetical protein
MDTSSLLDRDVMQVCRNGHVVTDRLRTCPEQAANRCERCGADTLDHCATCGREIAGAAIGVDLVPLGRSRPPRYCCLCGAAFPWTHPTCASAALDPLAEIETAVRRLPRVAAALRNRHADRPAFSVRDEFDLEDLLRALLPLYADEVRPESRTPSYAAATRTDLLLPALDLAVVVKQTGSAVRTPLAEQWAEDLLYYERRGYPVVMGVVADPTGSLPDAREWETAWSRVEGPVRLRVVILR